MTESPQPRQPFDPAYWPFVFTLLSMDVVIDFADLIALPSRAPTRLRDLLRRHIVEGRHQFNKDPKAHPFDPERLLAAIANDLGEREREAVTWWAEHIFEVGIDDHRDLAGWSDLLRACRGDAQRWSELGLPEALSAEARRGFAAAQDIDPYYQRVAEVRARPLSDWDLHMYAVNMFDDEDDALPTGPDRYLYPTTMAARAYAWWAWLVPQLSTAEQQELWRRASAMVSTTPSLRYIGALPKPHDLNVLMEGEESANG